MLQQIACAQIWARRLSLLPLETILGTNPFSNSDCLRWDYFIFAIVNLKLLILRQLPSSKTKTLKIRQQLQKRDRGLEKPKKIVHMAGKLLEGVRGNVFRKVVTPTTFQNPSVSPISEMPQSVATGKFSRRVGARGH